MPKLSKTNFDSSAKASNLNADEVGSAFQSSSRYASKWRKAAAQGSRRYGRNSKSLADISLADLSSIFSFFKRDPRALGRAADDAGDISQSTRKTAGAAPNPSKGNTPTDTTRIRRERIEGILGSITNTKVLGVLGLSGMLIYAEIITDGTDGVTATITNLRIDENDNSFAIITYTNPSAAGVFIPAIGDTVTLSVSTGLSSGNDFEIVDIPGDDMIKISITNIPSANRPQRGTVITPSPSSTPMTFTCHSDFGNQFSDAIDDLVGGVLGAAATAVNIALDSAGNIVLNAADLAGSLVTKAVDVTTDAAEQTFCKLLPFFCDSTIWIILIGLVVGGIILVVVLNSTKK